MTIAIYPMPTDINNKFLFSCKRFIPASNKTVHNFLAFLCGLGAKNEEQESKTARKMAQVKERGGVGSRFISRAVKPKIPFHGLFLLRNQTETLATQASLVLGRRFPSPSRSIHFGDVSETNRRETLSQKQNAHACVDF